VVAVVRLVIVVIQKPGIARQSETFAIFKRRACGYMSDLRGKGGFLNSRCALESLKFLANGMAMTGYLQRLFEAVGSPIVGTA
jgi:hypothetical protein